MPATPVINVATTAIKVAIINSSKGGIAGLLAGSGRTIHLFALAGYALAAPPVSAQDSTGRPAPVIYRTAEEQQGIGRFVSTIRGMFRAEVPKAPSPSKPPEENITISDDALSLGSLTNVPPGRVALPTTPTVPVSVTAAVSASPSVAVTPSRPAQAPVPALKAVQRAEQAVKAVPMVPVVDRVAVSYGADDVELAIDDRRRLARWANAARGDSKVTGLLVFTQTRSTGDEATQLGADRARQVFGLLREQGFNVGALRVSQIHLLAKPGTPQHLQLYLVRE
jgi:hypothetical protein